MSAQYQELLSQSTREVFETMSFMDIATMPPVEQDTAFPDVSITAIICLAGELSGMLAIHCSMDFAEKCTELISGGEIRPSERQICDTVGELANMIAGSFKRHMSSQVDLFDISLPSLVLSKGHRLFYKGSKDTFPRLLIPFGTGEDVKFYVELLIHKR